MRSRLSRRSLLAAVAALAALLALGLSMAGSGAEDAPASPAVLEGIGAKNREASVESAARLKALSAEAVADRGTAAEADRDPVTASR